MDKKQYLPTYENISKVRSLGYHDVEIKIYVEPLTSAFGCTCDIYECRIGNCKEIISGASQTNHMIEKHTFKQVLQFLGLLNEDELG